ncbi:hypothetical protein EVAR_56155_1 [Eumeta japonica]|uniref:Uncharacterized protein n=1 Tax=Eumeta variegata TaxID=151549 RepID=A0A4C1Y3L9_EUMVA|nr:hypothetical protein EVAR_56155_1 [Eumeta japonica]
MPLAVNRRRSMLEESSMRRFEVKRRRRTRTARTHVRVGCVFNCPKRIIVNETAFCFRTAVAAAPRRPDSVRRVGVGAVPYVPFFSFTSESRENAWQSERHTAATPGASRRVNSARRPPGRLAPAPSGRRRLCGVAYEINLHVGVSACPLSGIKFCYNSDSLMFSLFCLTMPRKPCLIPFTDEVCPPAISLFVGNLHLSLSRSSGVGVESNFISPITSSINEEPLRCPRSDAGRGRPSSKPTPQVPRAEALTSAPSLNER